MNRQRDESSFVGSCEAFARQQRKGWSQIEVLTSTLLVGVLMVGALGSYQSQLTAQSQIDSQYAAHQHCQILLSEILTRRFEETAGSTTLGRDSGESPSDRSTWDDVDDYQEYSDLSPQWGSVGDSSSRLTWTRKVKVRFISELNGTTVSSSRTNLKEITVWVNQGSVELAKLVAYVGAKLDSDWASLHQQRVNDDNDSNRSPIAIASVIPRRGGSTLAVKLSASTSKDPEADALTYKWLVEGTSIATSSEASVSINNTTTSYRVVTIELVVTDAKGNQGRDVARVVLDPGSTSTGGSGTNTGGSGGTDSGGGLIDISVGGGGIGINLGL